MHFQRHKSLLVKLQCSVFSSAEFFFSKIICQIKAGQNNKYKDLKSFSGLILPQIIFFGKFLSTFLAIVSSERMNLLDVMLQIELCPKTFAAVLAHVRSNIEFTTCFHEFFKYESTIFFYQYISVEKEIFLIGHFLLSFDYWGKAQQILHTL